MNALVVSGLIIGAAYGYIAQRGAFCLNSGFRFVVTRRDFTKVKALLLAMAVQMIAIPAVFALGWAQPSFPSFFPVGAILGGLLFGVSMYWAVGCAAGVWFKTGAGSLGAVAGIGGMMLGATLFEAGPFRGLRDAVHGLGGAVTFNATSLGLPLWALLVPLGAALIFFLMRTETTKAGAWTWRRTGLLLGLVGVAAWPLAALVERQFGMSVIGGTVDLARLASGATIPVKGFGGWDILFVLGLPLGAYFAARKEGAVKLSIPKAEDFAKMFAGGVGLGAGASLAAGCTVGHGLTGVPLLAPGSIVTLAAIFTGSALTGYYTLSQAKKAPQADCSGRPIMSGDCSGRPVPDGLKKMLSTCGDSPAVEAAPKENGAKTITIVIQNPPYKGDNKAWHGLRFAGASIAEGMNVHVHLLDDGVEVGKRGQKPPDG
ncbi:MAG: YeeE/YedE family protein, partial [Gammaproteobacteria bacterium]|nr:YeeE/YedE family protein [Gammaproteobacteria bacterium]